MTVWLEAVIGGMADRYLRMQAACDLAQIRQTRQRDGQPDALADRMATLVW